ncbi:GTPase [Candidatus Woesearchaeota archaeon CG10_big_fil_rev_8_21_14_0_10_34_8]|nr:MAG: GTPase [Candidatus Woesearchaeota archaeon CG10_big_fil_rev_8_21_14_0_10_34_8]
MPNFWRIVNAVIDKSDVLLEILDARLPYLTRNKEVEEKVGMTGKKLILVLNKADLIDQKTAEKYKKELSKEYPVVFVSSTEHHGTKMLREKILIACKKESIVVGVLGYPNTGKSSVINVLKGRKSASTSSQSGHTRGLQKIRITNRILMLDSPGVLPFTEKDETKHVLIGTTTNVKDPDVYACEIIKIYPYVIAKHYDVESYSDEYDLLEKIAEKRNMKIKGGEVDVDRAARMVIRDWQTGKIKLNSSFFHKD